MKLLRLLPRFRRANREMKVLEAREHWGGKHRWVFSELAPSWGTQTEVTTVS